MKLGVDILGITAIMFHVMSNQANTPETNPNSHNNPESDLRDLIQVLPQEWGWEQNDLAAFEANNWDGE